MGFIKELKQVIKYFSASKSAPEITFYSENGIYYQNYRGTIESILNKSNFKILYITSDLKDPIWDENNERLLPFYINKLVPFVFPLIKTKTLVLTMADLDQYHVKRSTNSVNHIYMFHAINSIHLQYNLGAFDHYDTIFCVGPHHVKEIQKTEEIYDLSPKELIKVGYSWLEEIEINSINKTENNNKILIAPSWSEGNILETYLDIILDELLPLQYEIVVRPHPEYIKRQKDRIKQIQNKYDSHKNFFLEINSASTRNVQESALLITDWSGIAIEFAWGMLKPVLFIDTPKKIHNPEYKKIGIAPLEDKIRHLIGTVLEASDCKNIANEIERIFQFKNNNKEELIDLRNENIFNWGRASEVGADYIINYCNEN